MERLGRECGSLFEPGELASYSNGGMIVAGRLLEVVTGRAYHDLLRDEIFAPAGMTTCLSAGEAILRSTAIGHFPTAEGTRPAEMFMLPGTWAPAGATPIGTVADLLSFGRAVGDGRLLPETSAARMRSVSIDLGTPVMSAIGLGWLIRTVGDTTVLTMSGASPGGVAVLAVMPEKDLVFAGFGNDPRALSLLDELVESLAGSPDPGSFSPVPQDLRRYEGTYRSDQLRIDVRAVGGELEETITYEPSDADQERIFTGFVGGPFSAPPMRYVPVGDGLFAPAGMPVSPHYLVAYLRGGMYRCSGGRMTRRVDV